MKKSKAVRMYCLRGPDGRLYTGTIDGLKSGVWGLSFNLVSDELGTEWRSRYWKRWDAAKLSAARRGWTIVPVEVREVSS